MVTDWATNTGVDLLLELDDSMRPLRSVTADAAGVASFTLTAPPAACRVILIQALDATSCATSDVGAL